MKFKDLMNLPDKSEEKIVPEEVPSEPEPNNWVTQIHEVREMIESTASGYLPAIDDIMGAYRLLTRKSIREYKGRGTRKALLAGLIFEANKALEILKNK